jgi:hypothetical protein
LTVSLFAGCALTILVGWDTAQAEDSVAPPFGLAWGAGLDDVGDYANVEQEGDDIGATLYPDGVPADTQEVVGFFCAELGLQEIQVASTRYDRATTLRRFGATLALMERDYGQHDAGNPDIGTAYWGKRLALEAYPASKSKFIIVATYNGPHRAACRSLGKP